ncbi:hypothetical protein [Microbulbifer sp. HZ11]|uniref:hypothetical protein n=1 Tax=Microbulbifer sp. HZ11 TaxID=1453501 RepID=UPI0005B9E0EF|nr:hypothetical protein [Microbulbifer sp. HZ11]
MLDLISRGRNLADSLAVNGYPPPIRQPSASANPYETSLSANPPNPPPPEPVFRVWQIILPDGRQVRMTGQPCDHAEALEAAKFHWPGATVDPYQPGKDARSTCTRGAP